MMLEFVAAIAIILFVSQIQVDVVAAPNSGVRTAKLVLLVLAAIAILFQRYH